MMQLCAPVAVPVVVTRPRRITVQPTLPAPSANVIAPGLFVVAADATLNGATLNVTSGRDVRSKVNVGVCATAPGKAVESLDAVIGVSVRSRTVLDGQQRDAAAEVGVHGVAARRQRDRAERRRLPGCRDRRFG